MKFSFQDQGMVEVVEEFARRLPPQVEQATEGQTNSLLEMIQAGGAGERGELSLRIRIGQSRRSGHRRDGDAAERRQRARGG